MKEGDFVEEIIELNNIKEAKNYVVNGHWLKRDEFLSTIKYHCLNLDLQDVKIKIKGNKRSLKKDVDIIFKCQSCGKENIRSLESIRTYNINKCAKCSAKGKNLKPRTLSELQQEIDRAYIDQELSFTIIEKNFNYRSNKQVIEISCNKCDTIQKSRIDFLTQGRKSCKCVNRRSVMEINARKLLDELGVSYQEEFTFDDLKDTIKLRFDFAIIKNGKIKLLELDGIQHFEPTFGEASFEATKKSDKKKNDYCKEKQIPLLRIKYNDDNKKEKIIDFINS